MPRSKQTELRALPIESWLTPKLVARHFGLKEDSAERWIKNGTIPKLFIRKHSAWFYRIHPDALAFLEQAFTKAHPVRSRKTA